MAHRNGMNTTQDYVAQTFRSHDVDIFYRLFGRPGKSPLVMVHGLSYFSYDWIRPAQGLADDREVAAMDMRGFGDSGWTKDYSIPANANDIVGFLDSRAWQTTVLIGHSMAGRHCTYCAATFPARVAGLVLVDWSPETAPAGSRRVAELVSGTPDSFATIEDAMAYFGADAHSPQGKNTRERFEAYLRNVEGSGFVLKRDPYFRDQFRQQLATGKRHPLGVDLWAALSAVRCPILVIRASDSDMFAREIGGKVRAANDRLELIEIKSSHNVASDNPGAFVASVRRFLTANRL